MDAHSAEQGRLLQAHVLSRQAELARERDNKWSAAGPDSVSPFVPCAADRIPAILRAARVTAEDVLWDLGCGDGRVLHHAAALYGCRVVGLDIDGACVDEARRRARDQGLEDRCEFAAADFNRLRDGALASGDLAGAAGPGSPTAVTPPTVVVLFITSHGLSRLAPFLHRAWSPGGLRLVTCVEALDSCIDFEAPDPLFGEAPGGPDWPVCRSHAAHGVYVVPPAGVGVDAWLQQGDPAPRPALGRAGADDTAPVTVRGLLSAADIAAIVAAGEAAVREDDAAALDEGGGPAEDAPLDLFGAEDAVEAAEQLHHRSGTHRVAHLHRGGRAAAAFPALLDRVLNRMRAVDREHWRLLQYRDVGVRSVEYHAYGPGGSVSDPEHRDSGSLVTLSALLSVPGAYEGGRLRFPEAQGSPSGDLAPSLGQGDAVVFVSERRHNVDTVTSGERRALVVELWDRPSNQRDRHR